MEPLKRGNCGLAGSPRAASSVAVPVRHFCHLLRERLGQAETRSGLVLGCGSGEEVIYLQGVFPQAYVVGLDVEPRFSPRARSEADLILADAKHLPFPPATFDFAAAIHSLEHMGDPRWALAEIHRVLRPGAWFYLGVPNKTRVLGYIGSPDVSLWQKVAWNISDYGKRLRGTFENQLGAHAGFEGEELVALLREYFSEVGLLTKGYLRFKYSRRLPGPILNFLLAPRVLNRSAPAHYALCRKKG